MAKTPSIKGHVCKTLAEVAYHCDVNLDSVKRWRSQGMPGKSGRYPLRDVLRWLRTDGPWKNSSRLDVSGDPLLNDGAESEGLERYRMAKAKHAELDLEERRAELIDRTKCRDVLVQWGMLLRRAGESLSKRFGNEAAATINNALDECHAVTRELLQVEDDGD